MILLEQLQGFQPVGAPQPSAWARGRGMFVAAVPALGAEIISGARMQFAGTPTRAPGPIGTGLLTNGSSSAGWFNIPRVSLQKWTIFAVQKATSPAVSTFSMALGSSTDNLPVCGLQTGSATATKCQIFARDDGGVSVSQEGTSATFYDGAIRTLALVFDGARLTAYADGRPDAGGSVSLSASAPFTVDRFAFGALRRSATGSFWAGTSYLGVAFTQPLSADEILALHRNPWMVLDGDTMALEEPAAGGATVFSRYYYDQIGQSQIGA